jgi:hypothetical protein
MRQLVPNLRTHLFQFAVRAASALRDHPRAVGDPQTPTLTKLANNLASTVAVAGFFKLRPASLRKQLEHPQTAMGDPTRIAWSFSLDAQTEDCSENG